MYATEFQAIIDKPYIEIPQYEQFKGHKVRITLINLDDTINDMTQKQEDFIDHLIQNPVEVSKDFKFLSREEANER